MWGGCDGESTQSRKTQGQHLEVHHWQCPNRDQPPGEGAKAEKQQSNEGRDGERAEGAMSVLESNSTTKDALPSREWDSCLVPQGDSLADAQPEITDLAAPARGTH